MYFPSSLHRQRFYDLVKTIIESDEEMTTNLSEDSPTELINVVIYVSLIHIINIKFNYMKL